MSEGWIKLHRKILDNPFYQDSRALHVFLDLLLNATHKPIQRSWCGELITLNPGQLITSRRAISERTKIDESKIKRVLRTLKVAQQIDQQTSSRSSLITIINWQHYQGGDQQNDQPVTSQCPANDQPVTTNKKLRSKEGKKEDKHPARINSDSNNREQPLGHISHAAGGLLKSLTSTDKNGTEFQARFAKYTVDRIVQAKNNWPPGYATENQQMECFRQIQNLLYHGEPIENISLTATYYIHHYKDGLADNPKPFRLANLFKPDNYKMLFGEINNENRIWFTHKDPILEHRKLQRDYEAVKKRPKEYSFQDVEERKRRLKAHEYAHRGLFISGA